MVRPTGTRHRFHGDPARFEVVAEYIGTRLADGVRFAADVAGGQGMLAKLLGKRYGISCEVIDPRGWTMKGVTSRQEIYRADMADYYDLVIGLHPDQAIREVARSAQIRPVVLVPCCNFWSPDEKLGRDALLAAIKQDYQAHSVTFEQVRFAFRGPYNIGLASRPPVPAAQPPSEASMPGTGLALSGHSQASGVSRAKALE